MRCALTMIRLSAAWRNTSVSRTTGTAPEPMMSAQHLAGADRRQLVDVADQDQRGMVRHRLQQSVHQRHVDHRGLVDDEQVAVQRVLLVAPEAAVHGIGFQQPMDRLRLAAGALRQPLRRPAGRRGQRDVDALDHQDLQDRVDQRRLADAGTAGDDEDLGNKRPPDPRTLA